jgi:hypothetical protein
MGPMSWLRFMFQSRLLARAAFGQMQRIYVQPCKVGRHVSMVGARAAASDEIVYYCFCLGPAKVFTMRGKYRQTFMRVSADGEEMTQSANLMVETNKTLPVVVEGVRISY